jgi:hypothetical protein
MMNPTAPLNSEADARTAARASAISIFIGVVMGVITVLMLMNGGLAEMEAAMQAQAAPDPQTAGMAGAMMQGALYFTIFLVVLQLILGFVQWARPNIVIPILFLVLIVYGLGSTALGMMMAGDAAVPQTSMNTPAMTAFTIVVLLIQALLHVVGIRGASALNRFRRGEVVGV